MTRKTDWTTVKFGDVVRQVKDKVDAKSSGLKWYVAGEHMDTDDLRIRRRGEITDDYLGPAFHMRFRPGHVLYGSRRTYLRKVTVADFEGICANTTFVLESRDPKVLLPELLPFIMQTEMFHEFSIQNSRGSVNPYINFSDLAEYGFALPPLAEQRRVIMRMTSLQALRDEIWTAVERAESTYQSCSLGVFAPVGVGQRPNPTYWCPRTWTSSTVQQLTQKQAPVCYGIVQVGEHKATGIPTLAIKDLRGDFVSGVHHTASDIESKYARSRVRGGDVLISIKATIGEVAIVPSFFTGNISRDLARIRLNPEKMHPDFFVHLYRSPPYQRYVASLIVGSTRAELSIGLLRRMIVPTPPLELQHEITSRLTNLDRGQRELNVRLDSAIELQRRVLSSLLSNCRLEKKV